MACHFPRITSRYSPKLCRVPLTPWPHPFGSPMGRETPVMGILLAVELKKVWT